MSEIEHTAAQTGAKTKAFRLKKTVALVGMMGAGKTAVGRAVAAKIGVPFLDSDAEIEAAANLTVPEIFQRDGEAFFRKREAEVIRRLLEHHRGILSTGGGAYLAEVNRSNISDKGVAVWLDADLDLLWTRVRHKDSRPLLRTDNPKRTLSEIFAARTPIYRLAELRVPCEAKISIEAMADRVIDTLLMRPDVLERTHD
ncbi:shikimate kinase [Sulfitobacter sp. HNIBRBA3233]|uniref:shikimate kinase n=1 Tax=Sulfitobacter marinivivus TaxID=3158558 RepID=UPI0032DF0D31